MGSTWDGRHAGAGAGSVVYSRLCSRTWGIDDVGKQTQTQTQTQTQAQTQARRSDSGWFALWPRQKLLAQCAVSVQSVQRVQAPQGERASPTQRLQATARPVSDPSPPSGL